MSQQINKEKANLQRDKRVFSYTSMSLTPAIQEFIMTKSAVAEAHVSQNYFFRRFIEA